MTSRARNRALSALQADREGMLEALTLDEEAEAPLLNHRSLLTDSRSGVDGHADAWPEVDHSSTIDGLKSSGDPWTQMLTHEMSQAHVVTDLWDKMGLDRVVRPPDDSKERLTVDALIERWSKDLITAN